MIIIGEKINGSIPSVAKAIAEKDAELIKHLAKIQTEANATFIDVCASVEDDIEVETMKWLIDLVQEVTDTPIAVDSPNPRVCVEAMKFCNKPGLINSISMEGDKAQVVLPVIADTEWEVCALLCDDTGIPQTAEKRLSVFADLMAEVRKLRSTTSIPAVFILIPLSRCFVQLKMVSIWLHQLCRRLRSSILLSISQVLYLTFPSTCL